MPAIWNMKLLCSAPKMPSDQNMQEQYNSARLRTGQGCLPKIAARAIQQHCQSERAKEPCQRHDAIDHIAARNTLARNHHNPCDQNYTGRNEKDESRIVTHFRLGPWHGAPPIQSQPAPE